MLIAAAVCPHPPLLVPTATGVSGPALAELERLRAVCLRAVGALAAEAPDLIAVVGGAPRTAEYPADATATLREFGIPFAIGEVSADLPVLPLSLTIARWLLVQVVPLAPPAGTDVGPLPPTVWWGIATDAPPGECRILGEKLAALAPRVALLAMGDGPGRRARGIEAAPDPAADRYDAQVAAALAAPDPAALAALDPGLDGDLFIAGRAAWQVLAGAATGDPFDAELHYAAAPFEVTYFVASWHRRAASLRSFRRQRIRRGRSEMADPADPARAPEFPYHGQVIWLTADQGGRRTGPPLPRPVWPYYAATAYVPPRTAKTGLASFVLRDFEAGAWRSRAEGRWLLVEGTEDHRVEAGTVIAVTEGNRVVAYFTVKHVAGPQAEDS
jgi:hypothetical protein